jgi:hypothetical protein
MNHTPLYLAPIIQCPKMIIPVEDVKKGSSWTKSDKKAARKAYKEQNKKALRSTSTDDVAQ